VFLRYIFLKFLICDPSVALFRASLMHCVCDM
jgi:hypothetical protein